MRRPLPPANRLPSSIEPCAAGSPAWSASSGLRACMRKKAGRTCSTPGAANRNRNRGGPGARLMWTAWPRRGDAGHTGIRSPLPRPAVPQLSLVEPAFNVRLALRRPLHLRPEGIHIRPVRGHSRVEALLHVAPNRGPFGTVIVDAPVQPGGDPPHEQAYHGPDADHRGEYGADAAVGIAHDEVAGQHWHPGAVDRQSGSTRRRWKVRGGRVAALPADPRAPRWSGP